jgi:hypothetical protein
MRYRVTNLSRNTLLADAALEADTFWTRFKGLMGRATLPAGEGLRIRPCNSIHTFFMKIPIDVIFLDQGDAVVEVLHAIAPWRVSRVYFGAKAVLELPAGTALASKTQAGDRLQFAVESSTG